MYVIFKLTYHIPLRRSLMWYSKVAFEILLNTSLINILSLYNKIKNCKMGITNFRQNIIFSIIKETNCIESLISIHSIIEKTTRNKYFILLIFILFIIIIKKRFS